MPETHATQKRQAARAVAELLRGAWRDFPPRLRVPAEDIDDAVALVGRTNAAALAWWRLRQTGLGDPGGIETLHEAYRYGALKSQLAESQLVSVLGVLRSAGLEPILLKGWDLARLYPRSELRPYEDIDLIVRPEDETRARRALAEHGPGDALVDLSHAEISVFDRADWEGLYARSRTLDLAGTAVRVLSPEDHLRAICLHGLKHCFSNPLWLCDVAVCVEATGDGFDWPRFFGADRPQDQWIGCALGLARELIGCHLPPAAAARAGALPRWLVPNVLDTWIRWASVGPDERWAVREFLDNPARGFHIVARRWPSQLVVRLKRRAPLTDDSLLVQRFYEFGYLFEGRRVAEALLRKKPERSTP